ncbi:MAG: hypothetical protein ACKVW3_01735 [Phycisphaerales bacterium]
MLPAIIALVALSWTNPATLADTALCSMSANAYSSIGTVRIHGSPAGSRRDSLLLEVPCAGAGLRQTATLDIAGQWSLWIVSVDRIGNESCRSNTVITQPALGAPDLPPSEGVTWHDAAGRRLDGAPTMPGVYFERLAGRTRKVRIVR